MRLDIFLHQTTIHTQCVICRLHFLPNLKFIRSIHFTKKTASRSYQSLIAEALCGKKSDCSSSPMMSSMLGLSSGARFRHLRMKARSIRFFTMATCSSRLSGSGSFRVQISQRRTPKLYTSSYVRQQNYS